MAYNNQNKKTASKKQDDKGYKDFYQKMGEDMNQDKEFYQESGLKNSDSFSEELPEKSYEKEDFYQEMGDNPKDEYPK
ncbi:hypothetical protein [Pseudobacillus wudalianchiensis]|uniref:Uncharacterized protein n=1 Tax=Pseudobacillus wudalianchiensis TaxID=1743143 RepID=A0A1B9AMG3_9BACI|nr:hypothetical protein [Bacillus wudalianchiensis]OCA84991.1 hypothetical protein A8F95_09810 [Bacillus wudalianchiensis]